jgi:hypothetical protein
MLQKLPIRMVNQDDPKDNALHNRMVELVERMLTLHKRLVDVRIPHNQTVIQQHAIGQEALRQHSAALLVLADAVRYGPGFIVFIVGLLLLAVGAILIAIAIWQSGTLSRWSGIPFALGFILYLPQFLGSQPIRVAHGLLVALGCIWIAFGMGTSTVTRK